MSMVIYVGMDVHLNSIAVAWGKALEKPRTLTITPTDEGFETLIKAIGVENVWGVYEASSCGFEVYDRLGEIGWKMSIVAPTPLPNQPTAGSGRPTYETP